MDFVLEYEGRPGEIVAELRCNGRLVGEAVLPNVKAVEKWAAKSARDYKAANTPDATRNHAVRVAGYARVRL